MSGRGLRISLTLTGLLPGASAEQLVLPLQDGVIRRACECRLIRLEMTQSGLALTPAHPTGVDLKRQQVSECLRRQVSNPFGGPGLKVRGATRPVPVAVVSSQHSKSEIH